MPGTEEKTPVTHVLCIIDMSGSMQHLVDDVRGGFNAYLDGLKADSDIAYRLTVTVFDTAFESLAVDVALADVPQLDSSNYRPRGGTALNDAIGKTLGEFAAKHGKVRKHERVLVVIQTDGYENSSVEFTTDQVRKMIAERDASDRWGFVFLGAGPDAFATGSSYGLGAQTIATNQSSVGTRSTYSGLAMASGGFSRGATSAETVHTVAATPGVVDPNVTP